MQRALSLAEDADTKTHQHRTVRLLAPLRENLGAPCRPSAPPHNAVRARHSFASLLLHEGRSVMYVARQLGHDARLALTRYCHVINERRESGKAERPKPA